MVVFGNEWVGLLFEMDCMGDVLGLYVEGMCEEIGDGCLRLIWQVE